MVQPLRRRTYRLFAGVAVAIVIGLAWWAWPRPLQVETVVVERGAVRSTLVDLGETRVRDAYVITAPANGELQRITLEPGDKVGQGDVVARIGPARSAPLDARTRATLVAALAQARAARDRARSEAVQAADDARRTASLWERRLVAEQAHRAAQSRARAMRAAVDEAGAGVARVEAELADLEGGGAPVDVRSPVSGVVLARHVESAQPVAAGQALLDIGNVADLEVVAEFLSQDAAQVRPGARAWIEGWGGPPVAAHVRRISPGGRRKVSALGVEEQRVDIWLDPEAPLPGIGHGFQVEARIEIASEENVLRVPVESLVRIGERWSVWRIAGGRLELVAVRPGISDGRWRVIDAGLSAGDLLARNPTNALQPGVRATSRTQPET